jgi:hypothetical protein
MAADAAEVSRYQYFGDQLSVVIGNVERGECFGQPAFHQIRREADGARR